MVAAIVLAVAVAVSVYWGAGGPRPYTLVQGPVPESATWIPAAPLNGNFTAAVQAGWWVGVEAWPSSQIYRLLSRQFWLAGTPFVDLFYLPVEWPSRLNLSANNISLDATGKYLVIPFEVRLQISGDDLWVYTILHGLTQNPFNDDCNCSVNHESPYGFGMAIREQQYRLGWSLHLQSAHTEVVGYNPSLPDAYSTPIFGNRSGLVPVTVDGQVVYATGSSGIEEDQMPPTISYNLGGWPINPFLGHGVSVDLGNSTIFVFDLPLSILPHDSTDVLFHAMFFLEAWPPANLNASSVAVDYKPGDPYVRDVPSGPEGWNNTAAYLPFWAPLPA